jgi:hypothetical protein
MFATASTYEAAKPETQKWHIRKWHDYMKFISFCCI